MALNFQDESEPKVSLKLCQQHNLKFDPEVTWGCVLCRSNRKKRISGYWLVAAVFSVAAAVYLLLPVIRPAEQLSLSSVVSVGERSTDTQNKSTNVHGTCIRDLSAKIEQCIAGVDPEGANARMDREFCLDNLQEGNHQCPEEEIRHDYLSAPLYNVNPIPNWQDIRDPIEMSQTQIEECVGGINYDFTVRITVNRSTGMANDVTLSLLGLNTSQRYCLYGYFQSLHFPASAATDYTFATNIESCALALNKPVIPDTRKEEFKKFLEQQRNAKLYEARHAETLKRRQEIDRKFKSDMTR